MKTRTFCFANDASSEGIGAGGFHRLTWCLEEGLVAFDLQPQGRWFFVFGFF